MRKKIATLLISCAIIATFAMTGCEINANETDSNMLPNKPDTEATEGIENDESTSTEYTTAPATELATAEEVVADEEGTFVYVDETVTNPTVAPIEIPEDNSNTAQISDVTPDLLAGTWKPLVALNVADNTEVPFTQAFGSAYSQYGGSLVISEDASFKISMGASIIEAKSHGTFTMSQNNLLVTYSDDSVDTFLYIPQYRNQEVIKAQIGSSYVYFYKEA